MLARKIDAREMIVVPAPSAFSLAAARLGWSLPETVLLSVHGRTLDLVRPHLQPGAHILALTSDGDGPAALARLLAQSGFGASRLTVFEALGGPRERMRTTMADEFDLGTVYALNTLAIEVEATPGARIIARSSGLADDLFEHDGQITKREVRAVTLSSLAPRRGELLWDIGAGAGSVAIEWLLADPLMRAVAVEKRGDRAARIRRNASAFGVPGLEIVEGAAAAALPGLAAPDAIFIGGGASEPGVIDAAIAALRPGGRLVVNAVTLETEALLIARHAALGGELIRIAISRAAAVGDKTGWRRGDAGDAMGLGKTMIAAGVGCRRGTPAPDIEAAIRAALARAEYHDRCARRHCHHRSQERRGRHSRRGGEARRCGDRGVGCGSQGRQATARRPIGTLARAHGRSVGRRGRGTCRRRTNREPYRLTSCGRHGDLRARGLGPCIRRRVMTVHFIGAGPGAADLITVRGRDLIARCPVCLYAGSIVPRELLAYCPAGARVVDTAPLSLDEIDAEFASAHAAGLDVARLHSGDLSIYSARSPSSCAASSDAAFLIR